MSDVGVDVLAEWRVVPENVVSLSVFAFGSRDGFVVEGVLILIYTSGHSRTTTLTILFPGASYHLALPTTAPVKDATSA